jgi:hypothetical protein
VNRSLKRVSSYQQILSLGDLHKVHKGWTNITTHIIFQYKDSEEDPIPMASVPLLKSCQSSLESFQLFHPKESLLSLKDRQRDRSLVGIETEPKLPMCLTEPLNQLSTMWHLISIYPTIFLEDLKPSCTTPRGIHSLEAFLTPDTSPATVLGYGLSFLPKSPTHPDVIEQSVQYCIDKSSQSLHATKQFMKWFWVCKR